MRTDTGQVIDLADYRPTDFVLERVDLTFDLDPTETKVEARLIFHRREGADPKAPLVLDGDELVTFRPALRPDGNAAGAIYGDSR